MSQLSKEEKVTQADWITLTDGEEVVHADHPSIWTSVPTILAGAVVALAGLASLVLLYDIHSAVILIGSLVFLVGLGTAAVAEVKRRNRWYVLTNERIMKKRGWYSLDTRETRYDRIQDVTVRVGAKERLLGHGNIEVTTSGTKSTEFHLRNIPGPKTISGQISKYKDKALERSYHQPSDSEDDTAP